MAAANIGRLREPKHVIYITENQTEDVSISQGTCAYTLLKECGLMWPRLLPNVVLRRNSTGCMFVTWAATLRFCSMLPCRFECSRAQLYQKAGVEILRSSCCIYRIMCNHNYTCMCYNNNKQTRRFGKGVDLLAFVCLFLLSVTYLFYFYFFVLASTAVFPTHEFICGSLPQYQHWPPHGFRSARPVLKSRRAAWLNLFYPHSSWLGAKLEVSVYYSTGSLSFHYSTSAGKTTPQLVQFCGKHWEGFYSEN